MPAIDSDPQLHGVLDHERRPDEVVDGGKRGRHPAVEFGDQGHHQHGEPHPRPVPSSLDRFGQRHVSGVLLESACRSSRRRRIFVPITATTHRLAANGRGVRTGPIEPSADPPRGRRSQRPLTLTRSAAQKQRRDDVGFFSRLLVPRSARRAVHPVRSARRAVTPKSVKRIRRAAHPVSNAIYGIERSLTTKPRSRTRRPVWHHGTCTINHRTEAAAARCRRTTSYCTGALTSA